MHPEVNDTAAMDIWEAFPADVGFRAARASAEGRCTPLLEKDTTEGLKSATDAGERTAGVGREVAKKGAQNFW